MEIKEKRKLEPLKSCFGTETAAMVRLCSKLSILEKNWQTLFKGQDEILGRQTAISKCVIEEDGITVKIAVADRAIITSLKFKEKRFKAVIEGFIETKVKRIDFAGGIVKRVSFAKEASRAYERYAPVIVTEEQVEKEKQELFRYTNNAELAKIIGKTKAMAEKKAKRKQ